MARKVRTKVSRKSKNNMSIVEEGINILNFAHSFGNGGYMPHNTGAMPRECLRMYTENEEFRNRVGDKSEYDYAVYLQKLYTKYSNSKFHSEMKAKNLIKLGQCNEILKEYEDYNGKV